MTGNLEGQLVVFRNMKNARGYPLTGEILVHDDNFAIVKAFGLHGPGSTTEINDVPLSELKLEVDCPDSGFKER